MFDKYLAQLDDLGATNHGLKPKHNAEGKPNVIYAQDLIDE
ncbi:hypothetical protein [Ruegeria meonggei]